MLLAMGALTGAGPYRFGTSVVVALSAALAADLTWYFIGRKRGHSGRLAARAAFLLNRIPALNTTRYWFPETGRLVFGHREVHPRLERACLAHGGPLAYADLEISGPDIRRWIGVVSAYMGIGDIFRDQLKMLHCSPSGSARGCCFSWSSPVLMDRLEVLATAAIHSALADGARHSGGI